MAAGAPATEFLRGTLSDGTVEAVGAASTLADPVVIVAVLAVAYWLGDHDRGAFALATAAFGLALVVALKQALGLPRPPATQHLASASGHGFPSGHAAGAVLVYGLLAGSVPLGPRAVRYGLAAGASLVVGLSRVALGVHFIGDVLGGFLVGLAVLVVAGEYARDRQLSLFLGAVALAAVAVTLGDTAAQSSLQTLGVACGGAVAWALLAPVPEPPRIVVAACAAVVLPVVLLLVSATDPVFDTPYLTTGAPAVGIALIVATPELAARTAASVGSRSSLPTRE